MQHTWLAKMFADILTAPPPFHLHPNSTTAQDIGALKEAALLCDADGTVRWLSAEVAPIAFGLSKVVLKGVVEQGGDIDAVVEVLEGLAGVLSVDLVDEQPCSAAL